MALTLLLFAVAIGFVAWLELPNWRIAAAARRAAGWPLAAVKSDPGVVLIIQDVSRYPREGWSGRKLGLVRHNVITETSAEDVWALHRSGDLRWYAPGDSTGYDHFAQYVRDNPGSAQSAARGVERARRLNLVGGIAFALILGVALVVEYSVLGLRPW